MNRSCARCEKVVYPIEELKCLDKTWHKACFKCTECGMALNMKTYKGFDKQPYCEAHIPKAKATAIADTPELKRIAENTKIQSNVQYHADFEKAKGKFTQVADDPETLRIKQNSKISSNVLYRGDLEKKAKMERLRTTAEVADSREESEYFSETLAAEQFSQYAPTLAVAAAPSPSSAATTTPLGGISTPPSQLSPTTNQHQHHNQQQLQQQQQQQQLQLQQQQRQMLYQQEMQQQQKQQQQYQQYQQQQQQLQQHQQQYQQQQQQQQTKQTQQQQHHTLPPPPIQHQQQNVADIIPSSQAASTQLHNNYKNSKQQLQLQQQQQQQHQQQLQQQQQQLQQQQLQYQHYQQPQTFRQILQPQTQQIQQPQQSQPIQNQQQQQQQPIKQTSHLYPSNSSSQTGTPNYSLKKNYPISYPSGSSANMSQNVTAPGGSVPGGATSVDNQTIQMRSEIVANSHHPAGGMPAVFDERHAKQYYDQMQQQQQMLNQQQIYIQQFAQGQDPRTIGGYMAAQPEDNAHELSVEEQDFNEYVEHVVKNSRAGIGSAYDRPATDMGNNNGQSNNGSIDGNSSCTTSTDITTNMNNNGIYNNVAGGDHARQHYAPKPRHNVAVSGNYSNGIGGTQQPTTSAAATGIVGNNTSNLSNIGKIADYDPLTDGPRQMPNTNRSSTTLIYSSDNRAAPANSHLPSRIGNVADIDPANGIYGSLAADAANSGNVTQQQLQQLQQQQQQQQQQQNYYASGNAQSTSAQKSGKLSTRIYRAIYDYEAQDTDEVSFREGDIIFEVESIDSGWMTGRVERTGNTGMLPANYVEETYI